MKNLIYNIKYYIPLIVSLISVFVLSLLWEKISLPYNKSNEIIGNYANSNHHQFNDTLRFILFILIPLFSYLLTFVLIDKENVLSIKQIIKHNEFENVKIEANNGFSYLFILIFFLIIIFHFLLVKFPDYKLDIFHEGQLLTGAMNYNLKNMFWTGSYLNTGLFYDILNTKFAWLLFDKENISAYRYFQQILNYLFYILIIFFVLNVSKLFYLENIKSNFFFITVTSFCLYFYAITYPHFPNYRDFFSILFLILLAGALLNQNFSKLNFFLIGNLSILSLLWSLDRGVFLNATLITVCFIFIFQKKFIEIIFLLLGIFFGWFIFLLILGPIEFTAFINNSYNILKFNELWNGIIHPTPFSDEKNSTRATKALILIFLNGIIIIRYIFDKRSKIAPQTKNFLIIYYIFAFFYYKVGLSRSDGGHIVIGSSLNYILFFIFIVYKILQIDLKKYNFISKFNNTFLLIYIFFIIILFNLSEVTKHNNLQNIINYKSRFTNFINLNNEFYLNEEYLSFYRELQKITINDSCIQNFNYDPTIYYLLKKPSCTRFYKIFIIASKNDQVTFIEELKKSKSNKLIIDTDNLLKLLGPQQRFEIINRYINKNYLNYIDKNNFKILIKNDN